MLDRILCLHEKNYDYNPKGMTSACNHYIFKSVEAAGLTKDIQVFYNDWEKKLGVHGMVQKLLRFAQDYRPEVLIFFTPFRVNLALGHALTYIRNAYGTRLVAFSSDSIAGAVNSAVYEAYQYYSEIADIFICSDSTCTKPFYNPDKTISGHTTADLRIFKPMPDVKKDIDVAFVGSIANGPLYGSRLRYLLHIEPILREKGYNLYVGGGQLYFFNDKSLSLAEYVNIVNRSRIVLNFSQTYDGLRHLKIRVMETMACKAFSMTEDCVDIKHFFEQGKEYDAFDSEEQLSEKLLHYLSHDAEREEIANAAYEKMTQIYTPCHVWGYILKKLGFAIDTANDGNFTKYAGIMETVQSTRTFPYPVFHSSQYIADMVAREQYQLAAELAMVKLGQSPLDANTWYNLGVALSALGRYSAAKLVFERCWLIDPLTKRKALPSLDNLFPETDSAAGFAVESLLNSTCTIEVIAVIVAKDNEATIARCLSSLRKAADKIVVVDTGSTDNTLEIVKGFTVEEKYFLLNDASDSFEYTVMSGITTAVFHTMAWVFLVYPDEYLFDEDVNNVKLAASLYSNQDSLLNVLSKPVLPDSMQRAVKEFDVVANRLFPVKNGVVVRPAGVDAGDTGMKSQTVGIRLYYDIAGNSRAL